MFRAAMSKRKGRCDADALQIGLVAVTPPPTETARILPSSTGGRCRLRTPLVIVADQKKGSVSSTTCRLIGLIVANQRDGHALDNSRCFLGTTLIVGACRRPIQQKQSAKSPLNFLSDLLDLTSIV